MSDFNIRSDSVNVEQIMEQIRSRIREKRGVDYTEQQIRELAAVKLEKFLDPRGVRSDLLEQFRKAQPAYTPPDLPNYAFEDQTLYESTRPPLRWIRKLLNPVLKLFFNPNPLIQALNIQARLNTMYGEREARREATRRAFDQLQYELMHNMVIETTRMSIEVKNLKMRVESLASRLEFNERRARALESVVLYKPSSEESPDASAPSPAREAKPVGPAQPPPVPFREHQKRPEPSQVMSSSGASGRSEPGRTPGQAFGAGTGQGPASSGAAPIEGPGQRSRRRRRRRGRRGGGSAAAIMTGSGQAAPTVPSSGAAPTASLEPVSSGRDSAVDHQEPDREASPDQAPSTRADREGRSGPEASTRPESEARSEPDDSQ